MAGKPTKLMCDVLRELVQPGRYLVFDKSFHPTSPNIVGTHADDRIVRHVAKGTGYALQRRGYLSPCEELPSERKWSWFHQPWQITDAGRAAIEPQR